MNRAFKLVILSGLAAGLVGSVQAGEVSATETIDETRAKSSVKFSYETKAEYSYVGDARTELDHGRTGNVSEQTGLARLVVGTQWNEGPIYRFGLEWQRASFGLPKAAPLPNTLQSIAAVVGVDLQLFNSWLVRIEAQPGIYGTGGGFRGNEFNVPFLLGGSYIASADVQWVVGVGVDVNREYPVIPAIGVRWRLGRQWVLNAILPSPRLEYEWQPGLTLFAGGDLRGGTYRVDSDFGSAHDKPRLNDAFVDYEEIRVGAGAVWKATSAVTFEIEGGYVPYRDLDFHRADTSFGLESGAAYGRVSLNARF